jgi:hypothetical protein
MSRLAQLRSGVTRSKYTTFPGSDQRLKLVVLTSQENIDASVATDQYCDEKKVKDSNVKSLVLQREMIYRFVRDEEDEQKKFFTKEEVQDLSNDEIGYFVQEYYLLLDQSNPTIERMTEEQLNEVKEALGKIQPSALNGEQSAILRRLALSLRLV